MEYANVVARNQDDHVKNIAFLMDQEGRWWLAPAFDVTYAFNPYGKWTSSHQMTINGKRDGFTTEDFKASGATAGLKRGQAERILKEVIDVVSRWPGYAEKARVREDQRAAMQETLRLSFPKD